MEYWNDGMMGFFKTLPLHNPIFHYSIIPFPHYPITPRF
jgi:hypothetical protein